MTDRRVGDVLDHPVTPLQRDVVLEQELRGRRVDAQHRRLLEVKPCRDRDRVGGGDAAPLRPVLALHVDDEVTRAQRRHAGAGRADAADALCPRRRRQRRVHPVGAADHRDVGRVDREGEHVEHDLAGPWHPDIRRLDAGGNLFRHAVGGYLDLLHRHPSADLPRF